MATQNLGTASSEEVECAICLDRLDNPRILSCLHSFCEKCLLKCTEGKHLTLECSVCKSITELPQDGVRGLRYDFRAARLVCLLQENESRKRKITRPSPKCDTCGKEGPPGRYSKFHFCRECCQVLCSQCSITHAALSSSKGHTVAKLSDLLSGKVTIKPKQKLEFCSKHCDEKLKLFCLTCSEPICHDCTQFDHSREKHHNFRFLADYNETIRTELLSQRKKVCSQAERFRKFISTLHGVEEFILENSKKKKRDIEAAVEENVTRANMHGRRAIADQDTFLQEKRREIQSLQQNAKQMKELAEKSSQVTEKVLENREDLIGMASMYKSLKEAMDKIIASTPDEYEMMSIKDSAAKVHYHITGTETKVGNAIINCDCKDKSEMTVVCEGGPKDAQFAHNGRLTVLTNDSPSIPQDRKYYVENGTRMIKCSNNYYGYHPVTSYTPYTFLNNPSFRQTASSSPARNAFAWNRSIPSLKYSNIKCFATLSDNRFVIVDTDNLITTLTDTTCGLTGWAQGLRDDKKLSAIATDKNIPTGQISPTGVAVQHFRPDHIVLTHYPATVCILDLEGKVKASVHKKAWVKVKVGCSTDHLYILWSDRYGRVTLQMYTMKGTFVDTIIDKETHACKDLIMAVSPEGTVAIVKATSKDGKVLVLHQRQ